MRSYLVLSVLAVLAAAQTSTTDVPADVVPTPDALDVEGLRDLPDPTYTVIDGLMSQDVPYATATAIATVSAEISESPLSVFPAVTSIAINAAGEDDAAATATATVEKRGDGSPLERRAACATQPTIPNYYNVDVSSYSNFRADSAIASVASAAPTPAGYFQNFKNLQGASNAYAYLGYVQVKTYDVATCAQKCSAKSGCLSFNIYFERDPTVDPGSGCENPPAFPNIKCSFWGSSLDATTANNYGQWRSNFQVGIAGSNGYTSYTIGGPIDGWVAPLKLNASAMNTPARDCSGTFTYLGYKVFQSGPFDPTLCAAACDSQTAYNVAHPPNKGYTPLCGAFGTYLLTKTNSSGSYPQGQMCTMYTSAWDAKYAVNTVAYDDSIGAKYTYSNSFYYSKTSVQPICPADLSYLSSSGSDFCSAYISYAQPTSTVSLTTTPATFMTQTTTVATVTVSLVTSTGNAVWKRDESNATMTTATDFTTVAALPTDSIAVLAEIQVATLPSNGTFESQTALDKRAVATPASITNWPSYKISAACSQIATGVATVTTITTASSLITTVQATATAGISTCVAPVQLNSQFSWSSIWGSWDSVNGQPGANPSAVYGSSSTVQLPFQMCMFGTCSNVISLGTDGYISFSDVTLSVYSKLGNGLYLYRGGPHGLFYRITGDVGSRELTLAWYGATVSWGHQSTHVTATYFEALPNQIQYKYYDAVQAAPYASIPSVYVQKGTTKTYAVPYGNAVDVGSQLSIKTGTDGSVTSVSKTMHDRVECCTKQGWHSCTEFTGRDTS